jgi:thiol:disulfide interchange protein DsbD
MKFLAAFLPAALFAACETAPESPVRWAIVDGAETTVASGQTVNVVVEADIREGWHVYSLTQKPGGPIPLHIELVGAADVSVQGAIRAPTPITKFDRAFGLETEHHVGKARFTVPLAVPAGSLNGKRDLQIAARYQACSDTLCLPPRTEKLSVTLRINPA